jgi:RNA polymerase sigma-70 factor (ECF subfamily)
LVTFARLLLQADNHSVDPQTLLLREKRAIERAQSGDLLALEPILAQHAEALFACILGRIGERAQAEDLLKDTFLTALERIRGFTWQERSIYHWLRQIALNKALDYHRAAGRRKRMCQSLRAELDASVEATAQTALSAEEERRIAQQRIEATLVGLHPRYAQVIRLRLCEERPRLECAATLGISVETFDVLLFRAVRAFRKAYGEPDV